MSSSFKYFYVRSLDKGNVREKIYQFASAQEVKFPGRESRNQMFVVGKIDIFLGLIPPGNIEAWWLNLPKNCSPREDSDIPKYAH